MDAGDTRVSLYRRFFAADFVPKAGTFAVDKGASLRSVLANSLVKPLHTDLSITLLPGWNIYDIDPYLAGLGVMPA